MKFLELVRSVTEHIDFLERKAGGAGPNQDEEVLVFDRGNAVYHQIWQVQEDFDGKLTVVIDRSTHDQVSIEKLLKNLNRAYNKLLLHLPFDKRLQLSVENGIRQTWSIVEAEDDEDEEDEVVIY